MENCQKACEKEKTNKELKQEVERLTLQARNLKLEVDYLNGLVRELEEEDYADADEVFRFERLLALSDMDKAKILVDLGHCNTESEARMWLQGQAVST